MIAVIDPYRTIKIHCRRFGKMMGEVDIGNFETIGQVCRGGCLIVVANAEPVFEIDQFSVFDRTERQEPCDIHYGLDVISKHREQDYQRETARADPDDAAHDQPHELCDRIESDPERIACETADVNDATICVYLPRDRVVVRAAEQPYEGLVERL